MNSCNFLFFFVFFNQNLESFLKIAILSIQISDGWIGQVGRTNENLCSYDVFNWRAFTSEFSESRKNNDYFKTLILGLHYVRDAHVREFDANTFFFG